MNFRRRLFSNLGFILCIALCSSVVCNGQQGGYGNQNDYYDYAQEDDNLYRDYAEKKNAAAVAAGGGG